MAIVHAHPIYCTTVACLRADIPAYHYMVGAAGGSSIRCAKYATFGSKVRTKGNELMNPRCASLIETFRSHHRLCVPCMQELSENMLTALRDGLRACLLANHGMICFGSSLSSAFKLVCERIFTFQNIHVLFVFSVRLPFNCCTQAVEVENLARQFVLIKSMGGQGVVLDSKEMEVRDGCDPLSTRIQKIMALHVTFVALH